MSVLDSIPEQEEHLERVMKGEQKQIIADWIAVNSGQYTQRTWQFERERYAKCVENYTAMYGECGLNRSEDFKIAMPQYMWQCTFMEESPDGTLLLKTKLITRAWGFIGTPDGLWHARGEMVLSKYDEDELPFFIDATRVILVNSPKIIPYLNRNHIPYEKLGIDY